MLLKYFILFLLYSKLRLNLRLVHTRIAAVFSFAKENKHGHIICETIENLIPVGI